MSFNPANLNFDLNPYDPAADAAATRAVVDERFEDEFSGMTESGPMITRPPQDVTAAAGSTAQFTVTAIGAGLLSYQWQLSSGSAWANISGATAAQHSVTASAGLNGQEYRCIVTDGSGRKTASEPATLTVI